VEWWERQVAVAESLLKHKRVFVKASHSVGKSFLAGGLVNWFFDSFDPGLCITTAPNAPQVRDILWKEVRVQRPADLRAALQPKAPRMETAPDHFAVGYTSRDGSGFQGRHEEFVLIVFDECVGVQAPFWDAAAGMLTGPHCFMLAICNPTDTGSRAFLECQNTEKWHVIEISALQHPNISAELSGLPPPFPKAVRLSWVRDRIQEWCTVEHSLSGSPSFEFPPGSGRFYRPGPLFESRVLGRWPTQGNASVWSDAMWLGAQERRSFDAAEPIAIGCDVARFGDDFTSIVARRGACVLWHETHNGWPTVETAGRLKQLARQFAAMADRVDRVDRTDRTDRTDNANATAALEAARRVAIFIDDDGVGGGVVDQADGYLFIPVSGASRAVEAEGYPNRRSELWFATAERGRDGRLDLSRLSEESRALLRRQLMAPMWKLDSQGRRVVEAKSETKKRIGRSPDDADALNLAFAASPAVEVDSALHAEFWSRDREEL